jgi:hypothetical protein
MSYRGPIETSETGLGLVDSGAEFGVELGGCGYILPAIGHQLLPLLRGNRPSDGNVSEVGFLFSIQGNLNTKISGYIQEPPTLEPWRLLSSQHNLGLCVEVDYMGREFPSQGEVAG